MTSQHIADVCREGKYEVASLLRMLQLSLDWEEQQTKLFTRLKALAAPTSRPTPSSSSSSSSFPITTTTTSSSSSSPAAAADANNPFADASYHIFTGRVSRAFGPYLRCYVDQEVLLLSPIVSSRLVSSHTPFFLLFAQTRISFGHRSCWITIIFKSTTFSSIDCTIEAIRISSA
jgi:hypothetical protein